MFTLQTQGVFERLQSEHYILCLFLCMGKLKKIIYINKSSRR